MPTPNNGRNRKYRRIASTSTPRLPRIDREFANFTSEFVTTREAAELLGLQESTIRKYCQDNIFANAQQFGHEWAVSRVDVDYWLENRLGKVGRTS